MKAACSGRTFVSAERFEKVLKLIRSAVAAAGLEIVGEIDTGRSAGGKRSLSRILFVDCPLLAFEALALDRAAGVFLPLHVLVCSDGTGTRVSVANPANLFEVRFPVGAAEPIEKLQARVAAAVEASLTKEVEADVRQLE